MLHLPEPHDFYIDANGRMTEHRMIGDLEVVYHYDDIPESDVTVVDGLRCTTPLRTVIDLAAEVSRDELDGLIRECLDRRMFTPQEAYARVSQSDLLLHRGATLFIQALSDITGGPDR